MKKKIIITFLSILLIALITAIAIYTRNSYYSNKFKQILDQAAQIPDSTWDQKYQKSVIKDKYKVIIIAGDGGEFSYCEYFKYSAEKLGWEVKLYERSIDNNETEILKFDPDFFVYTTFVNTNFSRKITLLKAKKYLIDFNPIQLTRDHFRQISKKNPYDFREDLRNLTLRADALLLGAKEIDIYRIMLQNNNKEFEGIRLLPHAPALNNAPAKPENLMWCTMGWDKNRNSAEYQKFITLLANNTQFKVYGRSGKLTYLPTGVYDGFIPTAMEMLDAIHQNGIYLLTHSDHHIKTSTPSLRIFEAVAANAVVISDMHPFAIENFGDNFLYFDQTADADTMYKQVKAHYDWIKANPKKAKAMADRAHKIFLEKFTLEKDLERIAKMHEYLLEKDKKMGLSYPLVY